MRALKKELSSKLWWTYFLFLLFYMHARFDYEALEPRTAYFIMRDLEALITDKSFSHQQFAVGSSIYSVERTDSFEYIDPVDGTVTKRQVWLW